jgi:hypothetical protein
MNAKNAVLAQSLSVSQFVIQELLKGIKVQVDIDGKLCDGYIHSIDLVKGHDFFFAGVLIEKENDEPVSVKVAIYADGSIIIPAKPDEK